MAKKAKATGRDGIDTWTNNGYGLKVGKSPITPAEARAIDRDAGKKKGKTNGRQR